MRPTWKFTAAFSLLTVVLTVPLYAAPPESKKTANACQEVEEACKHAGFVDKGANQGKGLWSDCIKPIMEGRPQYKNARPLPKVSSEVVSSCKTQDPSFGEASKPKSKS